MAVVGPADAVEDVARLAFEVGRRLARLGAVVVTGGEGGVMAAACAGARAENGLTVGLLPGPDRSTANPHLVVSLPTGLGEARNALVVRAADALVAVGGSWGTLSEVALAQRTGVPVISLAGWQVQSSDGVPVEGPVAAASAADAARDAVRLARELRPGGDRNRGYGAGHE